LQRINPFEFKISCLQGYLDNFTTARISRQTMLQLRGAAHTLGAEKAGRGTYTGNGSFSF